MKTNCPHCQFSFRRKKAKFCPHCGGSLEGSCTEIVMILDRSGSMGSCKEATIKGFNDFILQQKQLPGNANVTLCQFDHEYEIVHDRKPLNEIPPLDGNTYVPRGTTALFDAVGTTIQKTLSALNGTAKVIGVIITDGAENASKEYNREQIMALIKQRESLGWTFVYLGANQDAMKAAASIGIQHSANYDATPIGTERCYAAVDCCVGSYRTSGSVDESWAKAAK